MQASRVDGHTGCEQAGSGGGTGVAGAATFVTFMIAGQAFGVPVLVVQDILLPDRIAPIPLAHPAVRGSINVRGKIVTVVDVRARLGLPAGENGERRMGVAVENHGELYALLVDRVGDVLSLPASRFLVGVPLVSLATMLPLSLAGLGVREWAWVWFLAPFGVPAGDAVALSLGYFACPLLAGLVGGALFTARGAGPGLPTPAARAGDRPEAAGPG